ncbi:ADP-ribosylglycohydrolase family protein [Teredinibacter turnerae]|uniref:ADP-ribosylglycohydrolase family protein n=1 Tax=Teredinibacter turnerae TaxID=2426 RepID=UPI0030CE0FC9
MMTTQPQTQLDRKQRYRGSLLGLATGDALGTTVEFQPRGSFEPITDMVGGGPFHLRPGQWTDDTSMALCLGHSLLEKRGFDADDQMQRYCAWRTHGYMSSNGRCFDIGMTVSGALSRYQRKGDPFAGSTNPSAAGNGSIMRLAPVAMFFSPDLTQVRHFAALSSRTTHGAEECVDACALFGEMLHLALCGASKEAILQPTFVPGAERLSAIQQGAYLSKSSDQLKGSGYVVESLEAALWCFATTDSYANAVLAAVNLGDDADTTAAVCGQLAGAFYGEAAIPDAWLGKLSHRSQITELADGLLQNNA